MASPDAALNVLEVYTVAPPPTSPDSAAAAASPASLPLTFFDMLWLRYAPTQRLFFYESPHSNSTFFETILPKLKHSLSITLQHFLPLAGNLTWPPDSDIPILRYLEGDAVSLAVAESHADFHRLSGNDFCEATEFHPFIPDLPATQTQVPALALQVTLFPNTGFCIGYAAHHAVLDGKSVAMFMRSWASICRRGVESEPTLPPELTPLYDRTVIHDPADLLSIYSKAWLAHNGPNNRSLILLDFKPPIAAMRGTFELTRPDIDRIKKWVLAQWQEKRKGEEELSTHISTFTITVAYAWVCMVKARELGRKKSLLGFTVDCRARLKPPAPSNYFGNCIGGSGAELDTDDLVGEDGVAIAAKAIGKAIENLKNGVLKGAEHYVNLLLSFKDVGMISIGGSPHLKLYKADFGWGKPKKVEMVSIDKSGAFSLSESGDGNGGIEIGIVLQKNEIEAFASFFSSGLQAI